MTDVCLYVYMCIINTDHRCVQFCIINYDSLHLGTCIHVTYCASCAVWRCGLPVHEGEPRRWIQVAIQVLIILNVIMCRGSLLFCVWMDETTTQNVLLE